MNVVLLCAGVLQKLRVLPFLCVIILLNCLLGLFRVRCGEGLAFTHWTVWCFVPAWGVMLAGAATGMGGPDAFMGSAGQLPGFPWLMSLGAFHYFVESVVSSTFPHPSISIPKHWCRHRMLWSSAISDYLPWGRWYARTHMQTHFFLRRGPLSVDLPTFPCDGHVHHICIIPRIGWFCPAGMCLVHPLSSFL